MSKISVVLLFSVAACADSPPSEHTSETTPTPPEHVSTDGLERVNDSSLVCMVNDRFMGVAQIPIQAAGQTYYGCCENCVDRIQSDPEIRSAVDPVTGATVDKATAVIGRDAQNNLLYFESVESFARYQG